MQHPDEGTIHAYIDGELSQEEAAALKAHASECTECSAKVTEARGLAAASSRIVSALDIIPGDVIPAEAPTRKRPWYASTQLRAAAAVAIVAGASMLVMRDQKEATMDSVRSVAAPASAPATVQPQAEADNPVAQAETKASPSANTPAAARGDLSKEKAAAEAAAISRERLERKSAPIKAQAPPSAVVSAPQAQAPPPPAPIARDAADETTAAKAERSARDSTERRFGTTLSDLVVTTGVATVAASALKEVRADSAAGTVRTFYEVSPGVEVTLTETAPVAQQRLRAERGNADAASASPMVSLKRTPINSITWRDKRGHTMTLSGPVSKEQLESIRKKLPEEKR